MSSKAWIWISVLMAVAWGACTAEQEAPSPKTNASEISELLHVIYNTDNQIHGIFFYSHM